MNNKKRKLLADKGWKIGNTTEFLHLSPEEAEFIEMKLTLSKNLLETRRKKKITQEQLAQLLKSSQSRIAKMEAGDPSVSIDLLLRSLLTLGVTKKSVAQMLK